MTWCRFRHLQAPIRPVSERVIQREVWFIFLCQHLTTITTTTTPTPTNENHHHDFYVLVAKTITLYLIVIVCM